MPQSPNSAPSVLMLSVLQQQLDLLLSLVAVRETEITFELRYLATLIDRFNRLEHSQTDRKNRDSAGWQSFPLAPQLCSPHAPAFVDACSMPSCLLAPHFYPPLAPLPAPLLNSPIEALPVPLLESPIKGLPVLRLESSIEARSVPLLELLIETLAVRLFKL